jgi:sec-independent protein translocase protein TatA
MPAIGPLELGIILLIILVIFGPKRLPGLGRQLGAGMREFKDSLTGKDRDDEDDEGRPELDAARGADRDAGASDARREDRPASRADV